MVKLVEHVPAKRVGWIRCPVGSYRWLKIGTCGLSSLVLGVTGARGGGTSAPPKVFIWWKSWQNYLKSEQNPKFLQNPGRDLKSEQTPEYMSKSGANFDLKQNAPNVTCRAFFVFFGGHFFEFFSGKFGRVRAKILRTPTICLLLHVCSVLMGGCNETVHARCRHWFATSAASLRKELRGPQRKRTEMGAADQSWRSPKEYRIRVTKLKKL